MLNAKPGRQTQAEVPSLSSLPISTLLPLNSAIHSTYTEKRSVPIPGERGAARKELTHAPFLDTHRHDNTLSPSTHLPLPGSSSRSNVPIIASLFYPTVPRHFFVYFRTLKWVEVGKKTLIVIFKGENQSKEGGWDLYFHQKREYQLKVEKKELRLSLLQFPHYQ